MAAACIYVVESKAQPEVFTSIPASMWWAVVTLTTVGYGDVTPVTPLGRFLGALITILGVGLAALPAGILANGLANELELRKQELELRFRELIQNSDIDFILEKEKIEEIRKEVGLTQEQTQDIILQYYHGEFAVELKPDQSPVTIADVQTEQAIKNIIFFILLPPNFFYYIICYFLNMESKNALPFISPNFIASSFSE